MLYIIFKGLLKAFMLAVVYKLSSKFLNKTEVRYKLRKADLLLNNLIFFLASKKYKEFRNVCIRFLRIIFFIQIILLVVLDKFFDYNSSYLIFATAINTFFLFMLHFTNEILKKIKSDTILFMKLSGLLIVVLITAFFISPEFNNLAINTNILFYIGISYILLFTIFKPILLVPFFILSDIPILISWLVVKFIYFLFPKIKLRRAWEFIIRHI